MDARTNPLLIAATLTFMTACTTSGKEVGSQHYVKDDGAPVDDESCSATFHWLQKDAYANRAGRTTQFWPPHTTTEITVKCDSGYTTTAVRENHGTKPSDVDASGTQILVETKVSDPVSATFAQMKALLAAYADCECAPTTAFLTVDAVSPQAAQMFATLGSYVANSMTCDGVDLSQVVTWLQQGQVDSLLSELPKCTWNAGQDWPTGFATATKTVLGDEYGAYHVCNNDAQLESALWNGFAARPASLVSCNADSATCHGPTFFYNP